MDLNLLTPLIVALIPIIIWAVKKALPQSFLDKYGVMIPLAATALGPLLDWVNSLISTQPASPIRGLLLGGAAVALREVIDQAKKVGTP